MSPRCFIQYQEQSYELVKMKRREQVLGSRRTVIRDLEPFAAHRCWNVFPQHSRTENGRLNGTNSRKKNHQLSLHGGRVTCHSALCLFRSDARMPANMGLELSRMPRIALLDSQ